MNRVVFWWGWFAAVNLLWLWLISAWVDSEAVLGLFASALAATAATAVREQGMIPFRPRARWFLAGLLLPLRATVESAQVLGALARQLTGRGRVGGRFRTIETSMPDDPAEAATKRALVIFGESFAPNTYVLGIDERRGLVLIHELVGDTRTKGSSSG
jgi:hypothetical protein